MNTHSSRFGISHFLSGLPEPKRSQRAFMVLQAFVDDSGGKGQDKYFVFAGVVGTSAGWEEFSEDWHACMLADPTIEGPFKMRDAARLQSGFHGFTEQQRDDKLKALAQIINRHPRVCVQVTFDLEAHKDSWAKLPKPHNQPYFWAYHITLMAFAFEIYDLGFTDQSFDLIFDENVIFGHRAKRWYPVIREVVRVREPDLYPIVPVDLLFRNDEEFVPLQAADMFAWCTRHNTTHPSSQRFDWLLEEMPNLKGSHHSQFYDADRMFGVLRMAQQLGPGDIPKSLYEAYRKIYDDDD